ncbi:MAG TPA: aldose 1-epimerase family protein [Candidatus Faecousia intestinigallinarum]|nr:aldose 1-epimerase family protein [Candidatus Faecousia intestinigallinarum]
MVTIHNEFLTVTAAEKGAELQSILGADGTEYLWQGDAKYWPDRALNIFPYVARLTNGSFYLDGKLHHMAIHGIAPYQEFRTAAHTDTEMVLELVSNAETYESYPRQFAFRVIYALRGNTLEVTYQVENRDEKTMYFGLGGHPGFNVPLEKGQSFEDYRLRFRHAHTPSRVGFTEQCYLDGTAAPYALEDGRDIPLHHDLFDQDAIVLQEMDHEVTLESGKGGHSVTVTYPQMNYLGIWHMPRTDAPYVCIEPWSSLPSAQDTVAVLEEQKDLISLEPGNTYRSVWTIRVE